MDIPSWSLGLPQRFVYLLSNSVFISLSHKTVEPTSHYPYHHHSSLENDTDIYDEFQDISLGEKRIMRVGTKTFDKTGTYITLKLYKKNEDGEFKFHQAVTLMTREYGCLADNYSKI